MTRTVLAAPDFTAGLVQLRASCAMGAECSCAARIEATGAVDELAYLLDGSPVMLTVGLPIPVLAEMMMGMLIVSNMNQGAGIRDLPQIEDAELLNDERALFGEDLLDDAFPPEPTTDVMGDLRSLAEPPFDLVDVNDDGLEPDLYGQLPERVLQTT